MAGNDTSKYGKHGRKLLNAKRFFSEGKGHMMIEKSKYLFPYAPLSNRKAGKVFLH